MSVIRFLVREPTGGEQVGVARPSPVVGGELGMGRGLVGDMEPLRSPAGELELSVGEGEAGRGELGPGAADHAPQLGVFQMLWLDLFQSVGFQMPLHPTCPAIQWNTS